MTLLYVVVDIGITPSVLLYGSSLLVVIRTNYVKAFVHPKWFKNFGFKEPNVELDKKVVDMDCEIA